MYLVNSMSNIVWAWGLCMHTRIFSSAVSLPGMPVTAGKYKC